MLGAHARGKGPVRLRFANNEHRQAEAREAELHKER